MIGGASYAIYLVHYGLIVLFARTVYAYRPLASVFPEVTLTVLVAFIVLVGVSIHLWVEQPLLRFSRRLFLGESARGPYAAALTPPVPADIADSVTAAS
jgi:peptidoglycan/LPS O-acetylase OafA/YrhL